MDSSSKQKESFNIILASLTMHSDQLAKTTAFMEQLCSTSMLIFQPDLLSSHLSFLSTMELRFQISNTATTFGELTSQLCAMDNAKKVNILMELIAPIARFLTAFIAQQLNACSVTQLSSLLRSKTPVFVPITPF